MSIATLLTVQQLADILQISYKTALKVMKTSIPYVKVAGQYRIHPEQVQQYVEKSIQH